MRVYKFLILTFISGFSLSAGNTIAAEHKLVKPLTGYTCMALDAPEKVMMDFDHPIPLLEKPEANSAVIAPALAVLPVSSTVPETNGYVQSMNLILKKGWVPKQYIKPYSTVFPGKTCKPYIMDNGKLGFKFGP